MYFKALPQPDIENGLTFLTLDQVKMDFSVKDIKMGVENISNGNLVIRECATIGWTGETRVYMFFFRFAEAALNLFINSNSQELLKEMKPALREKLTLVMRNFIDKLFEKIPLDQFLD